MSKRELMKQINKTGTISQKNLGASLIASYEDNAGFDWQNDPVIQPNLSTDYREYLTVTLKITF